MTQIKIKREDIIDVVTWGDVYEITVHLLAGIGFSVLLIALFVIFG